MLSNTLIALSVAISVSGTAISRSQLSGESTSSQALGPAGAGPDGILVDMGSAPSGGARDLKVKQTSLENHSSNAAALPSSPGALPEGTNGTANALGGADKTAGANPKAGSTEGKMGDKALSGGPGVQKTGPLSPPKKDEVPKGATGKYPADSPLPPPKSGDKYGSKNASSGDAKGDKKGDKSLAPHHAIPSRWQLAATFTGILAGLSVLVS